MRVGFVTHLLWSRYGPFWRDLLVAAGAEVSSPEPERVRRAWQHPSVAALPGLAARGAGAEALALADCERIVVPELNAGYGGARGGAQDPFVASLPEALARSLGGLPPLLAVPAELRAEGLESVALETLLTVARDPGLVRRVWRTHRARARPPRSHGIRWSDPAARETVALAAQPWWLREEVRSTLEGPGEHLVSAHQEDPQGLRREGWRVDEGLAPSDAEAVGALRLFARRGAVARVRLLVDRASGADAWLQRRAQELVRKPLEVVGFQDDAALLPLAEPSGVREASG